MLDPAPERTTTLPLRPRPPVAGWCDPVADELDVADLAVRGTLPDDLEGTYVRNGPNPQLPGNRSADGHGDGMLHAVTLDRGRARYRNRWVVTRDLAASRRAAAPVADRTVWSDVNVVHHLGRTFSLGDGEVPYELTDGLGTVGEADFGGALRDGVTAHPKIDPVWDELCWFRTATDAPFLLYGVIGPRGQVTRTVQIDIPRPVHMHDFGVTDQHVVFFDCPAVLDPLAAARGDSLIQWREEHGARIGVLPRDGDTASVRWFAVEPRWVSHVANAFTDGSAVVADVVQHRAPALDRVAASPSPPGALHRITIDLARGAVTDERLDSRPVELPRIDDRRSGLAHRYVYAAAAAHGGGGMDQRAFDTLVRVDTQTRATTEHHFPEGIVVGEPVFVPAMGATREDDGWILAFTHDLTRDVSELVVLAADELAAPPIATVPLPQRVPAGAHGCWLPAHP